MSRRSPDLRTNTALRDWLSEKLSGFDNVEISDAERPSAGMSAETVLLQVHGGKDGARRRLDLVLRRQLEGQDLFLNPDLRWQYEVMQAMARQPAVPVPQVIGLESDPTILGSPFFVMKRVEGRVLPQRPNYNLSSWLADLPAAGQHRVWLSCVEAIALVHQVDWTKGFAFMASFDEGAPGLDQHLNHLARWLAWASEGREQPVAQAALEWLQYNRPENASVQVLWGDPTPANTLFGEDLEVNALLDWEMACLGPGEMDLAWFLMMDSFYSSLRGVPRLARLPDRSQIIAAYELAAGRKTEHLEYYEILALLRFAIIMIRASARYTARWPDPDFNAHTHNPLTAEMARRLGLPIPQSGPDWDRLMSPSRH
jgi:aminoglycoside phosphotransferase (APT) family kinase protein